MDILLEKGISRKPSVLKLLARRHEEDPHLDLLLKNFRSQEVYLPRSYLAKEVSRNNGLRISWYLLKENVVVGVARTKVENTDGTMLWGYTIPLPAVRVVVESAFFS